MNSEFNLRIFKNCWNANRGKHGIHF